MYTQKKRHSDMEDSAEFQWAAKVVIRRQLRDLLQQLQEYGDEVAVMLANTSEDMYTHFGTTVGEWFISEQRNLPANFLNFCKNKNNRSKKKSPSKMNSKVKPNKTPAKKELSKSLTLTKTGATPKQANLTGISEVLEVNIPTEMILTIPNQAVESLVGRLVAYVITNTEQKGSILPGKNTTDSPKSRSGRVIKAKVMLDGVVLKRPESQSSRDEDGVELLNKLDCIDEEFLQGLEVKVGRGGFVNVVSKPLLKSKTVGDLAVAVLRELQTLGNQLIGHKNGLKVVVTKSNQDGDKVRVKLIKVNKQSDHSENEDHDDYDDTLDTSNITNDFNNDHDNALDDTENMDVEDGPDVSGDDEEDFVESDSGLEKNPVKLENDDPDFKPDIEVKLKASKPPTLAERMENHLKQRKKRIKRHHTETMKVTCSHCGAQLTGVSNLKAHIRYMHMNIRDAECKICHKQFCTNGKLNVHMYDVHTRQCPSCKEYVVESEPWAEGMNNRMTRLVLCKCGEKVPVVTVYGRRSAPGQTEEFEEKKRRERDSDTRYSCAICGKLFLRKRSCLTHAKSHNKDNKECVCEVCGLAFTYSNSLIKHKQNEHGLLQHVCEICGSVYASEVSLKSHMSKAHNKVNLDTAYDVVDDLNQAKLAINTKVALESGVEVIVADDTEILMLNDVI